MLKPVYTKRFRKQFKLLQKRGMQMLNLKKVTDMLINEQPLPEKYCNHPLHGKWKGHFECHVEPDWLLVYRINKSQGEVTFSRTGTHSELF